MMSWTIRVGIPTPDDPEGRHGPGMWWITGSLVPAYQPDYGRRPRRGLRFWRRQHQEPDDEV
jgi:hypothetical protein